MSDRVKRIWVALCGVAGVVMLTAHFLIPAHVPPDSSSPATITQFVVHHHDVLLVTAWLQGFGPLLYVLFALGLAYLAGGVTRLAGWATILAIQPGHHLDHRPEPVGPGRRSHSGAR
jgi:hypothetical protein